MDAITIVSVNPTNGIASIGGASIIYTPTNAVPGTNVFSYTISGWIGGTNSALVTVYVTNRPPVTVDDNAFYRTQCGGDDSRAGQRQRSRWRCSDDCVGEPNERHRQHQRGEHHLPRRRMACRETNVFSYTISDGFGGTNSALVTVYVTNRPPLAVNDTANTARNVSVTIPVLANDSDPMGMR